MNKPLRIGFFVTCLVNSMRPNVALASIKLLEEEGCEVFVPEAQTCCGQPAFNNGDNATTKDIAIQLMNAFDECDYLVAPSGSCLGMIKTHYPELFKDDPSNLKKAQALSEKSYEVLTFLNEVLDIKIEQEFNASVTYHDSCSGLRELGIKKQPRELLNQVKGLDLIEMEDTEVCCGFGGTFCVKFPGISTSLVTDKVENISNTKAEVLLSGDLGCLMNIAGRCKRMGKNVRCYHAVEVLAGMATLPAIGEEVK